VRWYSPPDWTESEGSTEDKDSSYCGESMSTKGQLSLRMQKEGRCTSILPMVIDNPSHFYDQYLCYLATWI